MKTKPTTESKANKINFSMVFVPPEKDSIEYGSELTEYNEAREWLDQFYPCTQRTIATGRKILLIVGTESYVEEVWSMKKNNYQGVCYLEWIL
jgi:hypothetical protein